jgi:hypothetical protein
MEKTKDCDDVVYSAADIERKILSNPPLEEEEEWL